MMRIYHGLTLLALVASIAGCATQAAMTQQAVAPAGVAPTVTPVNVEELGGRVILADGEIKSGRPSLKLSFAGEAGGTLIALHVERGQRVREGDLIATLDDTRLRQAVEEAKLALQRAIEDREQALADAEKSYRKRAQEAEDKYERELREAKRALESARYNLKRLKMNPPTTSLEEARVNLARAKDAEAQAEDNYRRALDRPWEPQSIRDSLYKEWRERIKDRELAEMRLHDAQVALQVYYLDLAERERQVRDAETDLQQVRLEEVEKPQLAPSYERAIEDAQRKLADARRKLADACLYAPWDGLVVSVDATVGQAVSAGTPIVTLLDVNELYFVTENLSERHVAALREGLQARITLRAYPDKEVTGRVETVLPNTDRRTDAEARFVAYIRITPSELSILPGMTGRAEIVKD